MSNKRPHVTDDPPKILPPCISRISPSHTVTDHPPVKINRTGRSPSQTYNHGWVNNTQNEYDDPSTETLSNNIYPIPGYCENLHTHTNTNLGTHDTQVANGYLNYKNTGVCNINPAAVYAAKISRYSSSNASNCNFSRNSEHPFYHISQPLENSSISESTKNHEVNVGMTEHKSSSEDMTIQKTAPIHTHVGKSPNTHDTGVHMGLTNKRSMQSKQGLDVAGTEWMNVSPSTSVCHPPQPVTKWANASSFSSRVCPSQPGQLSDWTRIDTLPLSETFPRSPYQMSHISLDRLPHQTQNVVNYQERALDVPMSASSPLQSHLQYHQRQAYGTGMGVLIPPCSSLQSNLPTHQQGHGIDFSMSASSSHLPYYQTQNQALVPNASMSVSSPLQTHLPFDKCGNAIGDHISASSHNQSHSMYTGGGEMNAHLAALSRLPSDLPFQQTLYQGLPATLVQSALKPASFASPHSIPTPTSYASTSPHSTPTPTSYASTSPHSTPTPTSYAAMSPHSTLTPASYAVTSPHSTPTQTSCASTSPHSIPTPTSYAATSPHHIPTQASYASVSPHSTPTPASCASTSPHPTPTPASYAAMSPLSTLTPTSYAAMSPHSTLTPASYAVTSPHSTTTPASYTATSPHHIPTPALYAATSPHSIPIPALYAAMSPHSTPTSASYAATSPHSTPTPALYAATSPHSIPTPASYAATSPHSIPTPALYAAMSPHSTPTSASYASMLPHSTPTPASYAATSPHSIPTPALYAATSPHSIPKPASYASISPHSTHSTAHSIDKLTSYVSTLSHSASKLASFPSISPHSTPKLASYASISPHSIPKPTSSASTQASYFSTSPHLTSKLSPDLTNVDSYRQEPSAHLSLGPPSTPSNVPNTSESCLAPIPTDKIPTNVLDIADSYLAIELALCKALKGVTIPSKVTHVYNPLEYAIEPHTTYLHKYCTSTKSVLFLGMNPGPFGMAQTGVSKL